MTRDSVLLALALVFAPLSLMTIGGGVAILGDIQRAVVDQEHWLTAKEFAELFAVSRVAPGPGTLLVTLIGWHVAGWLGALVATLAIFLPSSLLLFGVAYFWHNRPGAGWQRAVAGGLAPIAAGLVLSSVLSLLLRAHGGWIAWVVAAAIGLAVLNLRASALSMLAAGSLAFLGLTLLFG